MNDSTASLGALSRRMASHARAWLRGISTKTRIVVAIVSATALSSAGLVAFAPEPDRRPPGEDAVPVASLLAEAQTLSPEVRLYGRVETPYSARLTALITATVVSLEAREGATVAAGDVLVQLDETDARLAARRMAADLAEAQADLESLERSGVDDRAVLRHQQELHSLAVKKAQWHQTLREQGSISQQTLNTVLNESHQQAIALARQRSQVDTFAHRRQRATARVERAEASLEEAQVRLERTAIRAPFPGRVTRIDVAPGELVSPGAVVAEIYDDSQLEIRVQIPNAHLPAIEQALAAGDRPRVRANFDDAVAAGVLDRLVAEVAKGRSGVDGLIRLDADGKPPDLGRAVEVRVTLPPVADAVAVPVQAIYGQRRLFVIEDGLLVGIDVERLGEAADGDGNLKLLVRADELADGVPILTSQLSNAVTGLRVSTVSPPPAERQRRAPHRVDATAA